jgi:hypothetical protein
MKYRFFVAFLVGLAGAAWADEVKLRNGGTLRGSTREENGNVVIDTGLGTITLPADQVVAVIPETVQVCQGPVADPGSGTPISTRPAATPARSSKNAIQTKDSRDSSRRIQSRRSHPRPEISPGYTYLGIPPLSSPRGSQNHGYGGSALLAFPTPMSGVFVTSP